MPDIQVDNPRDDVAAAWDTVANREAEAAPEPVAEVVTPTEPIGQKAEATPATDTRPRDEKGRFASKIGEKAEEAPPKAPEEPKVEAKPAAPPQPAPEAQKEDIPPPRTLPAPLREAWKKLDQTERDYFLKREGEINRLHSETHAERQLASRFRETVAPFEPMFRAQGVDTVQGVGVVLRDIAALATGPQQTKAQVIANAIRTYGVDIQTLDAILAGQPAPAAAPSQQSIDPQFITQQARQAVQATIQELQQKALQEKAEKAFNEFMADPPEFFDDEVRGVMEKLLSAGLAMDYTDAYNQAIERIPAHRRIAEQRRAAANSEAESMRRSMNAASSVKPQPASGPKLNTGGTIEDDVRDAWEKVMGRK